MTSVGIPHKQEGEKVIWILLKAGARARSPLKDLCEKRISPAASSPETLAYTEVQVRFRFRLFS